MEQASARRAPPAPRELLLRIASAIVMMAGGLAAAWFGGWAWALASGFVMAAFAFEWTRMADASRTYVSTAVPIAFLCGIGFVVGPEIVQITCVLALASALAMASQRGGPVAILGAGYIALTGYAFAALRADPGKGLLAIFALFAIVWATDTGAYVVGRRFGGAKLWPAVSPNKTWAGFLGGCIAGSVSVALCAAVVGLNWGLWLLVGLVCSVAAQAGDLLESMAKRHFGVKDTAGFIPGHGGLLDRLDGHLSAALLLLLLLAVPALRGALLG